MASFPPTPPMEDASSPVVREEEATDGIVSVAVGSGSKREEEEEEEGMPTVGEALESVGSGG